MLYEKIKSAAKEKGVSISELEKTLGFAQGSICKWNEVKPAFDKVVKVSDYLGISLTDLADVYSKE